MATITITRTLAETIQRLQAGGRILKHWFGRHYEIVYIVTPDDRNFDLDCNPRIPVELVNELIKLKLVTTMERPRRRFGRYVRRAWLLTEAGTNFRLPPEKFWVNE